MGLKNKVFNIFAILIITVFLIIFIEGVSSFLLTLNDFSKDKSGQNLSNEGRSGITQYDSYLGWIGKPGVIVENEYGEGKYVQINENGFREQIDTKKVVDDGQIRAICSGDSFTFGQGVANDDVWCYLLSNKNNKFETVNLGQNGYGVDQMYLRYINEGLMLEHSIHLFAFISGDLDRMWVDTKYGYGKPILKLDSESGELQTKNVPVPKLKWDLHRFINRMNLRSVEFINRLIDKFTDSKFDSKKMSEDVSPVARKVMSEIRRHALENNVVPIFIYLPTKNDLLKDLPWRLWAKDYMKKERMNYLDLTPLLREVSAGEASAFFIPQKYSARGHYTEKGNEWVAETIYQNIQNFPEVKAMLSSENQ